MEEEKQNLESPNIDAIRVARHEAGHQMKIAAKAVEEQDEAVKQAKERVDAVINEHPVLKEERERKRAQEATDEEVNPDAETDIEGSDTERPPVREKVWKKEVNDNNIVWNFFIFCLKFF